MIVKKHGISNFLSIPQYEKLKKPMNIT